MNKYLILIAGSPATGKSTIVNLLKKNYRDLLIIAPDDFKEMYADSIGFSNLEDKKLLEYEAWNSYYAILREYMYAGKQIITSEYPFSHKQSPYIKNFAKRFGYTLLTIRLVTEFETLWERRYNRDRKHDRHLSHLVKSYKYGDKLSDRSLADNHITKSEFKDIIMNRNYNQFELGNTIEIDTTNFEKENLFKIDKFLKKHIKL